MRRFWLQIILITALLSGWAAAQNGSAITTVQEASATVSAQQLEGLRFEWRSLGRVAGVAGDLRITNRSFEAVKVTLIPGLVFEDPKGHRQPFIIEDGLEVTLKAHESREFENMRAYNVDHSRGPAPHGERREYRVAKDLAPYNSSVQALWAGIRHSRDGDFDHVLKPVVHKTIVIQRAIWASLGAPNPTTKEKLVQDLHDDTRSDDHPFEPRKVEWMANGLWDDVEKTLKMAAAE